MPYNIWQIGGVTQDAAQLSADAGLQQGQTVEQVLSGSVSGDLGQYGTKLPTANDGLGVAFGAEYRRRSRSCRPTRPTRPTICSARALRARHDRSVRRQGAVRRSAHAAGAGQDRSRRTWRSKRATATRTTTSASTPTPTSSASTGRRSKTSVSVAAISARCARRMRRSCSCRTARAARRQHRSVRGRYRSRDRDVVTGGASAAQCALTRRHGGSVRHHPARTRPRSTTAWSAATRISIRKRSDTYSYGFVFTPSFLPHFSWSARLLRHQGREAHQQRRGGRHPQPLPQHRRRRLLRPRASRAGNRLALARRRGLRR